MMKLKAFGLALMALILVQGCDTIDCTLNNTVSYTCYFYANGKPVSINDTLYIYACGTDSLLINRKVGASNVILPMSYWNAEDTLVLDVRGNEYQLHDTIFIAKTNTPHYESPDCPTNMFHEITSIRTTHTFIDSITIVQPLVNYAETENIQIHFPGSAE